MEIIISEIKKLVSDLKEGFGDKGKTEARLLAIVGGLIMRCEYLERMISNKSDESSRMRDCVNR